MYTSFEGSDGAGSSEPLLFAYVISAKYALYSFCINTTVYESKVRHAYTTLTNFSTKYLVMCKVYTCIGGIKKYHVCPPERKIIHLLKLVDYPHVQADNPFYINYLIVVSCECIKNYATGSCCVMIGDTRGVSKDATTRVVYHV